MNFPQTVKSLNSLCASICFFLALVNYPTKILAQSPQEQIFFVNQNALNSNESGDSWENAFIDLQDALNAINPINPTQIWVAQGTYKPTTTDDRSQYFYIQGITAVLGGFNGTESFVEERDFRNNKTYLSGDIGVEGDPSDNSYHVVEYTDYTFEQIAIDGFIIKDGYADGEEKFGKGAGVYMESDPGYYPYLYLFNCTFEDNYALDGGAIYTQNANPAIYYCSFRNNRSKDTGGAIFTEFDYPNIINCEFYNNTTDQFGGAIYASILSTPLITNSTFYNNFAHKSGSSIYTWSSTPTIANSILWGGVGAIVDGNESSTVSVSNSIIEGGYFGFNNINKAPEFVDALNGNLRLDKCSPAIDAGNILGASSLDLDGADRLQGFGLDIGAYESNPNILQEEEELEKLFVNSSSTIENPDGSSWEMAYPSLGQALAQVKCDVEEIWIAAGTYTPDGDHGQFSHFKIPTGISIIGGFAGTEEELSERIISANPTIISGNMGLVDNQFDNAFHLLVTTFPNDETIIDGLIIQDGYVDCENFNTYGAGLFNYGKSESERGNVRVNNCVFKNNYAYFGGAAMYNKSVDAIVMNSVFMDNHTAFSGGAVFNEAGSKVEVSNCTFNNNVGYTDQSAFFTDDDASAEIVNTIFWGGDLDFTDAFGDPQIIKGETAEVSFSIVKGGYPGLNNLNLNPEFVYDNLGNLRIMQCSPAINAGSNEVSLTEDLDGNNRVFENMIDIGAYEWSGQTYPVPTGSRIYVNPQLSLENPDGETWETAFSSLDEAINFLKCDHQVQELWLAAGLYNPIGNQGRKSTFQLPDGVTLYGGFDGTESSVSERDILQNETILSGEIGDPNSLEDNCFHIVSAENVSSSTILDGFTVQDAYANGSNPDDLTDRFVNGGGLLIKANNGISCPSILNCTFKNNFAKEKGGAIFTYSLGESASCNPLISNCVFFNNEAADGAAIFCNAGTPRIINVDFHDNQANHFAAAIYNNAGSQLELQNALLYNNQSSASVATIYNANLAQITADNNTFYGNSTMIEIDGEMLPNYTILNQEQGVGSLTNCIFWAGAESFLMDANVDNPLSVTNNIFQNGIDIETNFDIDPEFQNPANFDFRLSNCSPAIDIGLQNTIVETDLTQGPRVVNGLIDLGALEFDYDDLDLILQEEAASLIYADKEITGSDGWTHYYNCETEKILFSIYKNGQDVGTIGTDNFAIRIGVNEHYGMGALDRSDADYVVLAEDQRWLVINRFWEVLNANIFTDPVKVRFYYGAVDYLDLQSSLQDYGVEILDDTELVFYKVTNANPHDTEVIANGGNLHAYHYGQNSSLVNWTSGIFDGIKYAEFDVNSFSGGSAGANTALGPLPVELISFSANRHEEDQAILNWSTANEFNNDYFAIERSQDGRSFTPIDVVIGNGESAMINNYIYIDKNPFRGINYYRLRQVDYDLSYSLSHIDEVYISNLSKDVVIYPNPVETTLHIQLPEYLSGMDIQLSLFDVQHRLVMTRTIKEITSEMYHFDVSTLSHGNYVLVLNNRSYTASLPVIVSRME